MGYNQLYIFVEGTDDKHFFEKIIRPKFMQRFDEVEIILYSKESKDWVKNYIHSITSMKCDYIFVVDIDNAPCITAKKSEVKKRFPNIDENKIVVVKKEIESWYLAGLEDELSKEFSIPMHKFNSTEHISKEEFNNLIPEKFRPGKRKDFMDEILNNFSIEKAKQRNKSFKYFVEKYNLY